MSSDAAPLADPAALDVAALESEITTLSGHIAAATARLLALLAAFDAAGGWQQIGIASCAQWLSWKCGLSPTTAREQLRVAKRLTLLPAIQSSFAGGEISYSKVRALTRVATPQTEVDLVGAARNATAEQVQRLCRGLTRAKTLNEALAQQASESFTHHWNDDGSFRFAGRLSAESGALLLKAIESQREILHGPLPEGESDFIPTEVSSPERSSGGSAKPGLPEDDSRSRAELAARSDAEALVRIAVHALDTPLAAFSGSPVRLVVHTTEAALAKSGPLGHLRPEELWPDEIQPVRDERPGGVIENGHGLLPETVQRLACNAIFEAAGDPDMPAPDMPAPDMPAPDAPAPGPERDPQRAASRRQRTALMRRDGGCRFPGCTRVRGLQAHHVTHHAAGGPTTMINLVLLCHHHHVLLHEGGWRLEWAAPSGSDAHPGTLRVGTLVAIGSRGQRVVESPQLAGRVAAVAGTHGHAIAADTIIGTWDGAPLGLDYAVSVYAQAMVQEKASAEAGQISGAEPHDQR